jgi:hypothetical protein
MLNMPPCITGIGSSVKFHNDSIELTNQVLLIALLQHAVLNKQHTKELKQKRIMPGNGSGCSIRCQLCHMQCM